MLNNNLKFCREEIGLTQKELGEVFDLHYTTISGWETGKDNMPLDKLIKFSNMYNFSIDYIVGLDRKNKKNKEPIIIDQKLLGNKLKKIRKELHLTQADISRECGIAQTTYSNY